MPTAITEMPSMLCTTPQVLYFTTRPGIPLRAGRPHLESVAPVCRAPVLGHQHPLPALTSKSHIAEQQQAACFAPVEATRVEGSADAAKALPVADRFVTRHMHAQIVFHDRSGKTHLTARGLA